MAGGRPSKYTQEIADAICAELATTSISLRKICLRAGMPCISTVMKWLSEMPAFSEQYARARMLQADVFAEEMIEIADDDSEDYYLVGDDVKVYTSVPVQRGRLKMDARKWAAGKQNPKKYGDKLDVTTDGKSLNVTVGYGKEDEG